MKKEDILQMLQPEVWLLGAVGCFNRTLILNTHKKWQRNGSESDDLAPSYVQTFVQAPHIAWPFLRPSLNELKVRGDIALAVMEPLTKGQPAYLDQMGSLCKLLQVPN